MCYNAREDEMKRIVSKYKQIIAEKRWLRKRLIPILLVLLVVAITVGIFFNRERLAELGSYGYLGAFLIALAANATIVFPIPGLLILIGMAAIPGLHPALIALAGASGGTIGELSGYMLGYSGRGFVEDTKVYARAVAWLQRWGILAIFVFAVNPFLPLDIAGMAAGSLRFPLWKFLAACWCGKAVVYLIGVYVGAWWWEFMLPYTC